MSIFFNFIDIFFRDVASIDTSLKRVDKFEIFRHEHIYVHIMKKFVVIDNI
jgi:hypothetical protein